MEEVRNNRLWEREGGRRKEQQVMGKRRWKKEGTTGYGKEKEEEGRNSRCPVIPAQSIYYLNIYYK